MSLLLAEYFIELSDNHTAQAKVCEKIANELSEGADLTHPANTVDPHEGTVANELTEEELAETAEAAIAREAAEKKRAAAAKRRAAAKKKKDAKAAEEATAAEEAAAAGQPEDSEPDLTALLARGQELTRAVVKSEGVEAARTILGKFNIGKVSEAADNGDVLVDVIAAFEAHAEAGSLD